MSAMSLALLLTTAAATAVGAAALHAAHGLRKQVTALRTELSEARAQGITVPAQSRSTVTPVAEIRAAVAEALAEEREREPPRPALSGPPRRPATPPTPRPCWAA